MEKFQRHVSKPHKKRMKTHTHTYGSIKKKTIKIKFKIRLEICKHHIKQIMKKYKKKICYELLLVWVNTKTFHLVSSKNINMILCSRLWLVNSKLSTHLHKSILFVFLYPKSKGLEIKIYPKWLSLFKKGKQRSTDQNPP